MRKRVREIWIHASLFVVACIVTLVIQPIFLMYFGVNRVIIEEAVSGSLFMAISSVVGFICFLVGEVLEKKRNI